MALMSYSLILCLKSLHHMLVSARYIMILIMFVLLSRKLYLKCLTKLNCKHTYIDYVATLRQISLLEVYHGNVDSFVTYIDPLFF